MVRVRVRVRVTFRYLCALLLNISVARHADDVVNIDITWDKSTARRDFVTLALPTTVAALCTFATSGSAQVFCH